MKKIFSFLFAILFAVGTTGVFTSCQEDAPEITINITMNNDFSDVVDAINNGTLKQEAAIAALTAAINAMNGEQNEKMDAIVKAINDLAKTTDAKLAIIEAAMKAQTLALENKLALLDAAIKALPDYTDQLKAIEAAIKALPDYSTKLAAIETAIKNIPDYSEKMAAIEAAIKNAPDYTTALEEIKKAIADAEDSFATQLGLLITAVEDLPDYGTQLQAIADAIPTIPNYEDQLAAIELALEAIAEKIEAQEGQYADELAALKASIDAIKSEVAAGNKSQEDALAEIIALLKSGALAGGGSGSGSGGEGEVDESYYVTFKSNAGFKIVVPRSEKNIYKIEGATVTGTTDIDGFSGAKSDFKKNFQGTMISLQPTAGVVTLKGKITQLISENGPTEIDATKNKMLEALELYDVETLVKLTVANDGALTYIDLMCCDGLQGANATTFMNSLPTRTAADDATLLVKDLSVNYNPSFSVDDIAIAQGKNWKVIDSKGDELIGKGETDETYYITFKSKNSELVIKIPQSEKGIYKIEGATVTKTYDYNGIDNGTGSFMKDYENTMLTLKPTTVGGEVKISGKITGFIASSEGLTEVDASHNKALELLVLKNNNDLETLVIANDGDLKYLHIGNIANTTLKANAQYIVNSLQNRTGALYMDHIFTTEQRDALAAKGWTREDF